tara:strand:+ start:1119 stop:1616 length:498 start_codon:yes stop_codon:yes gene_type:complete
MTIRRVFIAGGILSAIGIVSLPFVLRLYFAVFPFDILGAGHADFSAHLAGDYWLYRTSAYQIMIGPEAGWGDGTPIIPTMVVECATDGHYILAKRHGLKQRSPNDPNDTYEEEDSSKVDFWILDALSPKVLGPLDEASFRTHRGELAISGDLVLRDVYEFRPTKN